MFGIKTKIRSLIYLLSSNVSNLSHARINYDIIGRNNNISIGLHCKFSKLSLRIRGENNKIVVEDGVYIGPNCSFWMEGNNIEIVIGKNSSFTRLCHLCAQEDNTFIRIGEDCMFSNHIIVRTSDSHPMYDMETGLRTNPPKSVSIGNHVWVAPDSKIMKGSIIGDGAIVGSNTIVNKEFPSNSLIVGMPGKVVKTNVKWTRESLF